MGLWLRLGGNDAVRWTRPAAPGGLVLQLRRGLNFVGVVAGGAVNRFNAAASGAWRWDPARQQYQPYRFGDPALRAGDALWIQASAPVNWWQPGTAEPPFVFLGDVPAEIQSDILAEYSNVRRFFAEHFAVATSGRLYHIAADLDAVRAVHAPVVDRDPRPAICGWPSGEIHILLVKCAELTYFSSDYVTDLLLDIPGKGLGARWEPGLDPRGPRWLIEGMLLYAHTSYREAEGRLPLQQRENLHTTLPGYRSPTQALRSDRESRRGDHRLRACPRLLRRGVAGGTGREPRGVRLPQVDASLGRLASAVRDRLRHRRRGLLQAVRGLPRRGVPATSSPHRRS